MIRDLEYLLCEEGLRKLGLQPGEEKLRGNSSVQRNTWRERLKRRKTHFSMVLCDRLKGDKHKTNHRTFCLNI